MQFLHHASLTGAAPLQLAESDDGTVTSATEQVAVKSKSNNGILFPLMQLIRDPAASLETMLETFWVPDAAEVEEKEKKEKVMNRRQILTQRMTDVSESIISE
jgi:hypothetical protein